MNNMYLYIYREMREKPKVRKRKLKRLQPPWSLREHQLPPPIAHLPHRNSNPCSSPEISLQPGLMMLLSERQLAIRKLQAPKSPKSSHVQEELPFLWQ